LLSVPSIVRNSSGKSITRPPPGPPGPGPGPGAGGCGRPPRLPVSGTGPLPSSFRSISLEPRCPPRPPSCANAPSANTMNATMIAIVMVKKMSMLGADRFISFSFEVFVRIGEPALCECPATVSTLEPLNDKSQIPSMTVLSSLKNRLARPVISGETP
jgi:hypothetical protein